MKKPSVADCLDEIRRLRAENERLKRLVQTQRPELPRLRNIEVALRDYLMNGADTLKRLHGEVRELLGTNGDDLPGFAEMAGMLSVGAHRVDHAVGEPETDDAVDPVLTSSREPTTRD